MARSLSGDMELLGVLTVTGPNPRAAGEPMALLFVPVVYVLNTDWRNECVRDRLAMQVYHLARRLCGGRHP